MPTSDPKLLAERRKLPCMACGKWPTMNRYGKVENEAHHILAKGRGNAFGGDDWWNILTLCEDCHTAAEYAWHRGKERFLEKFPHLVPYLKFIGWIFFRTGYKLKLVHPAYRDCKPKQKPTWQVPLEAYEELKKGKAK